MELIMPEIKYPKFLLLIVTFGVAYLLFYGKDYPLLHEFIASLGYIGTFLAGMLFTYGFTAAPATSILIILAKEQSIVAAGAVAGLGALIGDLVIFKFIRHSFSDEIERMSNEKIFRRFGKIPNLFKRYLLPVLAGFIIASPLPDEVGISMLASSRAVSLKIFSLVSYILNTAGIFAILLIGNAI